MCGIAGIVAPDLAPHERLEFVREMVRRLRHRGPSGEAVWDGGACALGIARLAIVAPNQPARVLSSESGDVTGVTQEIQQKNQSGEPIPDELKNQGKAMGGNR